MTIGMNFKIQDPTFAGGKLVDHCRSWLSGFVAVVDALVMWAQHPQATAVIHNRATAQSQVFHARRVALFQPQSRCFASVTQSRGLLIDDSAARFTTTARF